MKKLTLEIDALKVESFRTGAIRDADGTIRGHAFEWDWQEDAIKRQANSMGCTDGCTKTCGSGGPVCCA
jgi:hypothetical protein